MPALIALGRYLAGMACAWLLFASCPAAAGDAPKLALVIGNSHYSGERGLANPGNDARLMAKTLATLGFTVTEAYDLTRERFPATVAGFAARLPAGATAFVYYAGHGMQIGGSNYLNPVDMPITSETSAKVYSYPLTALLERLAQARSAVNIVVLDACRNNPFQPGRATRYRSFGDLGLSRVDAPRGTLIAYSTSPGQLAPDGKGGNSLYTLTLAKAITQPGTELVSIFRQVTNDVRRQSSDDQIPWYESSLYGSYFFNAQDQARHAATAQTAGRGPTADAARRQAMRGMAPAEGELSPWYRQMTAVEFSQLDWEIQQRVRRLTPDELPALQHQASGGSVVAQTVLGLAYREGIEPIRLGGTVARHKANNGAAWKWLQKAAQAGFPVAQTEIGEMYYEGHGTERDPDKSRHWIELAARANYPRAKLDLLQLQGLSAPDGTNAADALRSMFESLQVPVAPVRRDR